MGVYPKSRIVRFKVSESNLRMHLIFYFSLARKEDFRYIVLKRKQSTGGKCMRRPMIGISASMMTDMEGGFFGCKKTYVYDEYVQSVLRGKGIPIILPMIEDEDVLRAQTECIDGLLLTGGHDVNPLLFGEEPHPDIQDVFPERDEFDRRLIEYMTQQKKPILGICRGEQILNAVHGGTLYQDLSHRDNTFVKHNQQHSPGKPLHTVKIEKNSRLYGILGEEVLINSFHHLAVKDIAPGFKATAFAKDGVIEAIEKQGEHFVLGVQWHPELLSREYPSMQKIFDEFIRELLLKSRLP